jgi:hypothetical protein
VHVAQDQYGAEVTIIRCIDVEAAKKEMRHNGQATLFVLARFSGPACEWRAEVARVELQAKMAGDPDDRRVLREWNKEISGKETQAAVCALVKWVGVLSRGSGYD